MVHIGILSSGEIPERDDLPGLVKSVEFGDSDEQFCHNVAEAFLKDIQCKGALIVVDGYKMSITCAIVTGEVLEDADVKQEMYFHLLGHFPKGV